MNTSTMEFPQLAQRINEVDLDDLLRNAASLPPSPNVPVIILSSNIGLFNNFSNQLAPPVFRCKSLHDFFRQGFSRSAFVLVSTKNRAECSRHDLMEIVSARCKKPFEVVWFDSEKRNTLISLIGEACVRVQKKRAIETTMENSVQKIVSDPHSSPQNPLEIDEITISRKYQFVKKLLNSRISEEIKNKPESFLRKEITKIRFH